jgi:hypothetical protein
MDQRLASPSSCAVPFQKVGILTFIPLFSGHGMQGRPLQRSLSDDLLLVLCI